MKINIPKGTKDILPEETYKWQYIERTFLETCKELGFDEIRTPIFEHKELFTRAVGDTTDIVQKQMYVFQDLGERWITLKPEGTAPVVRAFVENKMFAKTQPTKLCYITPCFRYEKPQAGRLRQFHQMAVEAFGSKSMLQDAEVIYLADRFLKKLGIQDLELKINSIGCPTCREKHRESLKEFLASKLDELCKTCQSRYERNPMRILDCKSPKCQELGEGAPVMLDYLCEDCDKAFDELKANLDAMNVNYEIDPYIVRGLDYYTKTAFEFVSGDIGAKSTVCGGGRYDNLVDEIGEITAPGVGFGLGIERLLLTLDALNIEIQDNNKNEVFVAFMGDEVKEYALKKVIEFRKSGISVQIDTQERNFKGQLKYANKLGVKYTVIIGENEMNSGVLMLKDMETSQQEEIKEVDIINIMKNKLGIS